MNEPRSVVRVALTRFILLSFGTLVVIGAGAAVVSENIAEDEAVRDARERTVRISSGIAQPLVNKAVRRQAARDLRILDRALRTRVDDGTVSHIVVWDDTGRILWADDADQIGSRATLPPDVQAIAGRPGAVVMNPEDRDAHPGREAGEGDLLEVYVGAVDADGEPFVFEAYTAPQRIAEDSRAIFLELLPLALGALLLLQLASLPLALSLARRIDRSTAQRSLILSRSLMSWHEERRRLAQELHDGVIQDLSAIGYALPAVLARLPDDPESEAARAVGLRMTEALNLDLRALRAMLVDLVPTGLEGSDLGVALESLAARSADRGLDVRVSVDPDLAPGSAVAGLVYRVVQEGLRNAEKHAEAQEVSVEVRGAEADADLVEIVVSDDGRGVQGASAANGHVGLRLLEQLVNEVGGTLELGDRPEGGATLLVVVPAALPGLDQDPRP